MITEDYILRMIQDMVRMVLRLTGQKMETPYTPEQLLSLRAGDMPLFPQRLQVLLDQGEINEAENRLFEEIDFSDLRQLPMALAFYQYLNTFSDPRLEASGFSREEIREGLRDCAVKFGIDEKLFQISG